MVFCYDVKLLYVVEYAIFQVMQKVYNSSPPENLEDLKDVFWEENH